MVSERLPLSRATLHFGLRDVPVFSRFSCPGSKNRLPGEGCDRQITPSFAFCGTLYILEAVRIPDLRVMKATGTKIAVLTAYDATMARLLDRAVLTLFSSAIPWEWWWLGFESTIPVTLDMMIHHTQA
jgi:hypothetical protein